MIIILIFFLLILIFPVILRSPYNFVACSMTKNTYYIWNTAQTGYPPD